MHIEKNVLDNIMNTVMDTDRTKDNEKARLDLPELCKRPDLHLRHVGDNCWSKPKAAYTLTSEQQQDVYRWVQQLRFPDGYASNLARCVSLSQGRFIGMKSHDCHIFMQCLLPTAFRELPTNIWKPLTELSQFFKDLCSTTLKVHDLEVMEQNIPIILCKLERIFPPKFFNVMEHLPIHLAYEARVCVDLSNIGGCIHLNGPGHKVGKAKDHWLDERDKAAAHLHILLNESKDFYGPLSKDRTLPPSVLPFAFRSLQQDEFTVVYLVAVVPVCVQNQCNEIVDPGLQSLSWGPSNKATSYPIYKVNGYTFHTLARSKGKKTDNTGVFVKGDIGNGESDWFGVLEDILELEYTGSDSNRVVLFKCQWYDPSHPNGTRIHNDYKITEVNHSKRYRHYDPFIVAQKAKQVYFLPYPGNCKSMWRVVVNTKPRGRIEINHVHVEEDEEENDVAYQADESNPSRISDTEPPISLKSPFGEDRIVELSIGSSSGANKNDDDDVADFNDDIDF
ncbi:uncharacterized protein [Arachis hypogaea]|uniref:uncharacterized protein n=1 Tax=Arachis hypogaea TaxID=3818 RepID=UPI000DEC6B15|nr:uncharacterized protein LOC112795047 [Arachis hypogaea]